MGQLGGKGDDAVMFGRGGEGEARKSDVQEESLQRFQQLHVRAGVRSEDHGRPYIQIVGGGSEAAPLPARHGVAADVGKAMLRGDGGDGLHHRPLDAAEVHQNGTLGDAGGVLPHPLHGGAGPDGHQHQIAFRQILRRQRGVNGAAHPGHGHGLGVQVRTVDGVGGAVFDALGHGPADEAQADDANDHLTPPVPSRRRGALKASWPGRRTPRA